MYSQLVILHLMRIAANKIRIVKNAVSGICLLSRFCYNGLVTGNSSVDARNNGCYPSIILVIILNLAVFFKMIPVVFVISCFCRGCLGFRLGPSELIAKSCGKCIQHVGGRH